LRIGLETISGGSGFSIGGGGMPTYYRGLISAMADQLGDAQLIVLHPPGDRSPLELPNRPEIRGVSCAGLPKGRVGRVIYEHLRLPSLARSLEVDVLLSTVNVRPLGWRGPSVVVLQSMQSFFIPDRIGVPRKGYLRAAVPRSLRGADRVIAVSEAARTDAIELFGLDPQRIVTVHHGCSPWALEAAAEFARDGVPPPPSPIGDRPYFLNVSPLYGLKNQARLVEAFAIACRATGAPHELAIAGREAEVKYADLRRTTIEMGIEERVHLLGEFPQAELPALYANAAAVAYPSLYETFGHPVLEAFALGTPLLTSDRGGSAEVAGGAAALVNPYDVESIADGLTHLMTDDGLRRRLREAGEKRLGDFSWRRSAAGTLGVLRDAYAASSAG
jgi:glycosyltransferase involved in cell wall biosynthesis